MNAKPTFCCGDYAFSIDGNQEFVRSLTESFADLSCRPTSSSAWQWRFDVEDDRVTLTINGTEVFSRVSTGLAPAWAVSSLTREVLDHEPNLLHLHATTVVDGDDAMVVAGPSGSGKSTLSTALVASGWAYVSDEIISVEPESLRVRSFPKPISVKSTAIATVEQLTNVQAPTGPRWPWMLAASNVGLLAAPKPYDVHTVALYTYEPDEPTRIAPLHRATMVRALLADGQDAERMGGRSLVVAARLAETANCLQVSSGDALDVAESLRQIHRTPQNKGSMLELGSADVQGSGPRRGEPLSSVLLDGRALIFEAEAARIVELDEVTSTWWAIFDGTAFDVLAHEFAEQFEISPEQARTTGHAAIDQLQELGFLAV